MTAAASNLDTDRFEKVRRLMMDGATDGERAAAHARAEAMATRAGMTLAEAVSKVDGASKVRPDVNNFDFSAWADDLARRDPTFRAKQAERAADLARRRADILSRYGSEEALFAKTERETLLEAAVKSIARWGYWTEDNGKRHRFVKSLDGITPPCGYWSIKDITPAIRGAVVGAYPWPSTLREAMDEVRAFDALETDRNTWCGEGEWTHDAPADCRVQILQHELATGFPAASWDDVDARFAWFSYCEGWNLPTTAEMMARLQADFAALRQRYGDGSTTVLRTTAEKRASVLSILNSNPELTDREIARRLGVSPTTVGTIRRKRA